MCSENSCNLIAEFVVSHQNIIFWQNIDWLKPPKKRNSINCWYNLMFRRKTTRVNLFFAEIKLCSWRKRWFKYCFDSDSIKFEINFRDAQAPATRVVVPSGAPSESPTRFTVYLGANFNFRDKLKKTHQNGWFLTMKTQKLDRCERFW